MQHVALAVGFDSASERVLDTVLTSAGFGVRFLPGGRGGLPPDLLCATVTLVNVDATTEVGAGWESPASHVILCGVADDPIAIQQALDAGADDVLLEGWSQRDLVARVVVAARRTMQADTTDWCQQQLEIGPDYPTTQGAATNLAVPSTGPMTSSDVHRAVRTAHTSEPCAYSVGTKVLIADPDRDVRLLFRHTLECEGFAVIESTSGDEAIRQAVQHEPAVIMLAADLPVMDGIEATRYLKTDPVCHDIPIVILSAASDRSDVRAGLKAGADGYISKPILPDEFLLRVQSMVKLHSRRSVLLDSHEMRGEQTRALVCMLDFSSAIVSATTVEEVLERTLAVTAELTCCKRVALLLPDADKSALWVRASIGLAPDYVSATRIRPREMTIGRVFLQACTVVANDESDSVRLADEGERPMLHGVPWLAAPLTAPDHVVGVLAVSERWGKEPFTLAELGYIALISNNAGAAISEIDSSRTRDEARNSIVLALAKLAEHRDNETGRHVERVTRFAQVLAESLRFDPVTGGVIDDAYVRDLERAVALHDIGKVAIPDHILRKPGKFTREEFHAIKRHTIVGEETIRSVRQRVPGVRFLEMAEEIAGGHHEWYDGTGYPRGLSGAAIPLSARIAALADVYDALTTKRVYKDPFTHDKSRDMIMRASGTHFDPSVVAAFLKKEADIRRLAEELADDTTRGADPAVSIDLMVGQTA